MVGDALLGGLDTKISVEGTCIITVHGQHINTVGSDSIHQCLVSGLSLNFLLNVLHHLL